MSFKCLVKWEIDGRVTENKSGPTYVLRLLMKMCFELVHGPLIMG